MSKRFYTFSSIIHLKDSKMMSMKSQIDELRENSEDVILSLEQKAFCVFLSKSGVCHQKESNQISELKKTLNSGIAWLDYTADDVKKEALDIALEIGFSQKLILRLLKNDRGKYEDYDNEFGLVFPSVVVNELDVKISPLLILIRKNRIVTIHTKEVRRFFHLRRYAKIFMKKIKTNQPSIDKLTSILIRIIEENNSRNFDHMREIEEYSDKISERLSNMKTTNQELSKDIHLMKHALVTYLNALWETIDVLNALRHGDPKLLSDDPLILQKIGSTVSEVNTHIGLAEHMSEVLSSGLEVMQSVYNNQLQILNNKLALLVAYLTVIGTAVLVPNTLATALSSPVFALTPQDAGWYTLLLLISTVVSTIVAYLWVKKSGLLPEKAE